MTSGYVAYYRVSTDRQGDTRLGLDAQRAAVRSYAGETPILAEFREIESGRSHTNRPELAEAIELCRKSGGTLITAKLDRLARDVHFVSGLMKSRIGFVAVDMPQATPFMLHIHAAVAEYERAMISQRTRAALAEARKRGTRLGNPRWEESLPRARAKRNPTPAAPETIKLVQSYRNQGMTLRAIAAELNGMGVSSPRGGKWHPQSIQNTLTRSAAE